MTNKIIPPTAGVKPNKLSQDDIDFYIGLYRKQSNIAAEHVITVKDLAVSIGGKHRVRYMNELIAAAIVHDLADLSGHEATAEEAYERVLKDELLNSRFDEMRVSMIANAVRKHRPNCEDKEYSPMEMTLRDADALAGFVNKTKLLVRDKYRLIEQFTNPIELLFATLDYVFDKYRPGNYGFRALHFKDTRRIIRDGIITLSKLKSTHKYKELCSMAELDVNIVYHGGCDKLDILEGVSRNNRFENQKGLLFASTLSEFAITYSGGKWNDYTIEQKLVGNEVIMTELAKGEFDKNFNQPGYLYICDGQEFETLNQYRNVVAIHNPNIVVTKSSIKPLYTIPISNVLNDIKNIHITLNYYDRDSEEYQSAVKRLGKLINAGEYNLQDCEKLNPVLASDIESINK